jgi:outer membrane protein assembly factor BamB
MSDGHIPHDAIMWMKKILDTTSATMPVIFLNHYPLDNQMDNWYEVIDMFKKKNTILFLCGHGHQNKALNFEDIPGVMGRSNLRAKQPVGGYNLVDVRTDSVLFTEVNPLTDEKKTWAKVKINQHKYDLTKKFARPDYTINDQYSQVKIKWKFSSDANVISTPAVTNDLVVFGNQAGMITALSLKSGKQKWTFKTGGSIYSSPATHDKKIVFGSADGFIYCLNDNGKELWKAKTSAAVLGSPAIIDVQWFLDAIDTSFIQHNYTVYIGGSDHSFRAINLVTGKEIWSYNGLDGPVVSTPVTNKNDIIFGAWDTYLYSLNKNTGKLNWKWSNGSSIRNYSPAACIPVIKDDVIFIVAPDRYLTAIDAASGKTLWRTNESTVRESIGMSEDGKYIYGKTMNDTLAVFTATREQQPAAWKMNVGYGYEHTPSMLIEKDDIIFFGTRNGVVYAINSLDKKIEWAHKIDNSMINTVRVIDKRNVIVSTMDGKVVLLQAE